MNENIEATVRRRGKHFPYSFNINIQPEINRKYTTNTNFQEKEALDKRARAERTQLSDAQLRIQSLEHELYATSQVTDAMPTSRTQRVVRPPSPGSPVLPDGGDLFMYSSVPINGTTTDIVTELPPTTSVYTPVTQDAPPRKRKAYTVTRGVNTAPMGPVEPDIQPIPRVSIQPANTIQSQLPVMGSSVVAPVYTQCTIPTVATQFKPPATCQHYTAPQSITVAPALPGSSTAQAAQPTIASQMPTMVVLLLSLLLYSQSILLVVLYLVLVRLQLHQ